MTATEALTRLLACPDLNMDSLEPETVAAIAAAQAALAEPPRTENHGVCDGIRLTRDNAGVCKVFMLYHGVEIEVIADRRKVIDHMVEGWKVNSRIKEALGASAV